MNLEPRFGHNFFTDIIFQNSIFQKQLRLAREKSNPPKPAVTPNPKRTSTRDKSQKLYHIDKFEKLGKWFSRIFFTLKFIDRILRKFMVSENQKKWKDRTMPFVEAMNRPHCHLDLQSRLIKFAITKIPSTTGCKMKYASHSPTGCHFSFENRYSVWKSVILESLISLSKMN